MMRNLTAEEMDQMILVFMKRLTGRWEVETHAGHIVKVARVMRPREVEEILADENLLTDPDVMVELC